MCNTSVHRIISDVGYRPIYEAFTRSNIDLTNIRLYSLAVDFYLKKYLEGIFKKLKIL